MQGLADGYFVLPYTIGDYLAKGKSDQGTGGDAFKEAKEQVDSRVDNLVKVKGKRSPDAFHRELGKIMWDNCGMARSKESLEKALELIPKLKEEFWQDVKIVGEKDELNQTLEKAGRVADFLEFSQVMVRDALTREESCGGHFRVESQTEDGEAKRDDENFSHAAVWEFAGEGKQPIRNEEPLKYDYCKPSARSYK